MPQTIWSPEAERNIEEIAFYIGVQDGRPTVAENVVRQLHELCDLIATQPEMGEARPEFGPACRVFPFKQRWIVLYRPSHESIRVLRVVDGARDFDQLFPSE